MRDLPALTMTEPSRMTTPSLRTPAPSSRVGQARSPSPQSGFAALYVVALLALCTVGFTVIWVVGNDGVGTTAWSILLGTAALAILCLYVEAKRNLLACITFLATTMLIVGAVGLLVDLALIETGVLGFATPEPRIAAVVWFAGLWAHFTPSVPVMFGWLRVRLWLSVPLGVIGGPAAYWIASKLGAVSLMQDWSLFAIAAQWAVLFPLSAWALTRPRGVFLRRAGGDSASGATP